MEIENDKDSALKGYYALNPKVLGVMGIVKGEPVLREQDEQAIAEEFFAVVFFPRLELLGPARVNFFGLHLSQSREAAIVKFLDSMALEQTWEEYERAGHKVRRVRVTDLGDAAPLTPPVAGRE